MEGEQIKIVYEALILTFFISESLILQPQSLLFSFIYKEKLDRSFQ